MHNQNHSHTSEKPFLSTIQELRRRARQHIEKGAVTESYQGDTEAFVKVLNEALATELVCVLRYKRHYFMAEGIHAEPVAQEFLQHATEEQAHADQIARRITQLGGEPDLNPDSLSLRSHSEYQEGDSLVDMVKEDLIAERIAVESYGEMVRFFGDKDPTTGHLNDTIISNNGDSEKVLVTVVAAIYAFTDKHQDIWVYATGSTKSRTRLYRMGITKYLSQAKKDFEVYGEVGEDWELFKNNKEYDGFLIRRKK